LGFFSRKPKGDSLIDEKSKDLIKEARARHKAASQAEDEQRQLELDDLRFCDPANQWPEDVKGQRSAEGRACLSVDRLNPFVHQLVNDFRQNRPQPNVNPVGDGADKETAEVLQGMIRHIAYLSNGDVALDTAYESMARCGRGYFRVVTEYSDPETFEQDITIKRIPNPHLVYLDPAFTEPDGSDAEWGFVGSYLSKDVYKSEYPKSRMAGLEDSEWKSIGDTAPEWAQEDGCYVVEYFRKVRRSVTVYLLADGTTTTEKPEAFEDSRTSYKIEVQWFKLNAIEVLEETIWPGKYIPIVPMLGSELNVDGKRTWSGLIRSAKDAQRAFNYWKSAQAEVIALAPKAPWVGPRGAFGSGAQRAMWSASNKRPVAFLEFEAYDDQQRPIPMPQRQVIEPPIMAITQAMVGAVDDLKATTGMYDASLGNRESGQSGVAIRQLQRQGQTGNFHYTDNAARSVRHLGRILVDLIPKVYDTQRVVRIVKPDESTDLVTVNGPSGVKDKKTGVEKIYDLKTGVYDVTVSVGPGYQTKRQENLALLESLMQGPLGNVLTTVAPDLVASELDFSIAPKLVERLKKTLPPQFQEAEDGAPQVPPQVQQQMQTLMQQHEQLTQALQAAQDQLEDLEAGNAAKIRAEEIKAETDIKVAEIRAQAEIVKAQLSAQVPGAEQNSQELLMQLSDLQELVLAMHERMTNPEPAMTAGEEQPDTAGLEAGMEQQ